MLPEIEQLLDELRGFAALKPVEGTKERENRLPELVRFIRRFGKEERLADALASHLKSPWAPPQPLVEAIRCATLTQFDVGGKRILPWGGGFTVVILSHEGETRGVRRPVGRVYEEYGQNLYPYALTKALFTMHLHLSSREGGLDKLDNFNYLESLGFKRGEDLFLGENQLGTGDHVTYIGASGCELAEAYVSDLLPKDMRESYSVDFIAGHADMIFARSIAGYLMFPGTPAPIQEPKFFSQLRIAH